MTKELTSKLIAGAWLLGIVLSLLEVQADSPAKGTLANKPVDYNLKLSHKTHIEFVRKCEDCKQDCTDCHTLDKKTDTYELNKKFCDKCHVNKPPDPWKPPKTARKLETEKVEFKHTEHIRTESGREMKCVECHETTMSDKHKENTLHISSRQCFSCHVKERVKVPERTCDRCHLEKNKRGLLPADHKKTWSVRHGRAAEWQTSDEHGQDCYLCHAKSGCVTCHLNTKPRNHSGLWKARMHGVAATWDGNRCKTCHETGACVSCHKTTAPLNHRGSWKAIHGISAQTKRSESCGVCHHKAWCATCHANRR